MLRRAWVGFVVGLFAAGLLSLAFGLGPNRARLPQFFDHCAQALDWQKQLARSGATPEDWPQLSRYQQANAELAPPTPEEDRVVFLGDSITEWWSRVAEGGFFPDQPFINRGIGRQTTAQLLLRFRQDVIDLAPKAVVIQAGSNDLAGHTGPFSMKTIQGNYQSMVDLAQAHGIKVILASVLPVRDVQRAQHTLQRSPDQIRQLNAWLKQYAASQGLVYLDYYSVVVDDRGLLQESLSEDGLHPNARGYAEMMPLTETAIAAALSSSSKVLSAN